MNAKKQSRLHKIDPEWWLISSLFAVSVAVILIPFTSHMLLFLYLGPVMIAAYVHGRRHSILTAVACVLLVSSGTFFKVLLLDSDFKVSLSNEHWGELLTWSLLLVAFGWGLGWLFGDFRQTHEGFADIMRYMVGRDNERHNYVRRLSYISGVIAEELGLPAQQCEVIRRAALLRDIGQLELSRDTFRRFSMICQEEDSHEIKATDSEVSLGEVMDLVLSEKIYGTKIDRQPLGARILALAMEYDDLTTSQKRRSALPPSVARTMIEREGGKKFDASLVRAFSRACDNGAFSPAARRYSAAAGD